MENIKCSDKLIGLINKNDKIEKKDFLISILSFLESIIPEDLRENFYNNLETIEIRLNLASNFRELEYNGELTVAGGYDVQNNSLVINPGILRELWEISCYVSPDAASNFFEIGLKAMVLHELIHMASSSFDKNTGQVISGFYGLGNKNIGLTEGAVEYISFLGVPDAIEIFSGYYVELLFVRQISLIVGHDKLMKYFFSNNLNGLKSEFHNIIENEDIDNLFDKIEENFKKKRFDGEKKELFEVQNKLIKFFFKNLHNNILSGKFDEEELYELIDNYENNLVTKENIVYVDKNVNNYLGLDSSVNIFNAFKNAIPSIIEYSKNDSMVKRTR